MVKTNPRKKKKAKKKIKISKSHLKNSKNSTHKKLLSTLIRHYRYKGKIIFWLLLLYPTSTMFHIWGISLVVSFPLMSLPDLKDFKEIIPSIYVEPINTERQPKWRLSNRIKHLNKSVIFTTRSIKMSMNGLISVLIISAELAPTGTPKSANRYSSTSKKMAKFWNKKWPNVAARNVICF